VSPPAGPRAFLRTGRRLLVAGPQRRPDRGVRLALGETGRLASAGQLVQDVMTVLLNGPVRGPVQRVVPVAFALGSDVAGQVGQVLWPRGRRPLARLAVPLRLRVEQLLRCLPVERVLARPVAGNDIPAAADL
jgi:hypothetical protein